MSLPLPHIDILRSLSNDYVLHATDEELHAYLEYIEHDLEHLKAMDEWNSPLVEAEKHKYKGRSHHQAKPEENPHNAWYQRTNLTGHNPTSHLLSGYTVGIKDNISVASIPMMIGSRLLEGYVSNMDATVVKRVLDHGGTIVGTTTCENLCISASSYNTTYGPVRNPWNPSYSAGGSSSGSGVVVATGEASVALGGDQGGSVRIPASSCGIVGLKPTYGLVPYTGCGGIEYTLDHCGPMARTVTDCARLLAAIAGFDDRKDSRQPSCGFHSPNFVEQVAQAKPMTLRVGVLKEGFHECEEVVINVVTHAINLIKASNRFLKVAEVSIPEHDKAMLPYSAVLFYGAMNSFIDGYGSGTGAHGVQCPELIDKLHQGLKTHAHTLHHLAKQFILAVSYIKRHGGAKLYTSYAKGQTWGWILGKEYDKVLAEYDVILMPTLTHMPAKLPTEGTSIKEIMDNSANQIKNTAPFDLTHHPALTVNAGYDDRTGLPIGLQIVGRLWDDATVLKAGKLIEEILAKEQKPFPTLITH